MGTCCTRNPINWDSVKWVKHHSISSQPVQFYVLTSLTPSRLHSQQDRSLTGRGINHSWEVVHYPNFNYWIQLVTYLGVSRKKSCIGGKSEVNRSCFLSAKRKRNGEGFSLVYTHFLFGWMTRHVFSGSVPRFAELLFCRTYQLGLGIDVGLPAIIFWQNRG